MEGNFFERLPKRLRLAVSALSVAGALTDEIALALFVKNGFDEPGQIMAELIDLNVRQSLGGVYWKVDDSFEDDALKHLDNKIPEACATLSEVMEGFTALEFVVNGKKITSHFCVASSEFQRPTLRKAAITKSLCFAGETSDDRGYNPKLVRIVGQHFKDNEVTPKEISASAKGIEKLHPEVYRMWFAK